MNYTSPFLDWISYTSLGSLPEGFSVGHLIRPRRGYDHAFSLVPSGRVDWNSRLPGMSGIQFSGADIEAVRVHRNSIDAELLKSAFEGSASRVDLCVDVSINPQVAITELVSAIREGKFKSRLKKIIEIKGLAVCGGGHTLYLGSPASELRVRIYDKTSESRLDYELTRVEIQARNKKAKRLCALSVKSGVWRAYASALKSSAFFDVAWYNEILSKQPTERFTVPKKQTSTSLWLATQVLPALRRVKYEQPELFFDFLSKLIDISIDNR